MPASLESLQRAFAESLDSDRRPMLAQLRVSDSAASGNASANGKTSVDHDTPLNQRIGLYRTSVRSHRRTALANAYPVLLALVGDTYFDALSNAYAREHPSQSGDMNRFGAALPAFIESYETDLQFRYFADLARLEWALHIAYFAADAKTLTQPEWAAIHPDDLLDARLAIHPACTPIASRYAIADIWTAHQPHGGTLPTEIDSPTYALIVRPQWRPELLIHTAASHAAFVALQRDATLNEALDAAFEIDAGFNFTSQWRAWIAASAITDALKPTRTIPA